MFIIWGWRDLYNIKKFQIESIGRFLQYKIEIFSPKRNVYLKG